jgi:DUF1365 family protein
MPSNISASEAVHSALYLGRVRHRRSKPRRHAFAYRLFMVYVDLGELDRLFSGRWLWSARRPAVAWLRRADYLGDPNVSLDQAVRDRVEKETGERPNGPIRMLTHLRYFGLCFNPVTFYYCFNAADTGVETIAAEITNTPWNERYTYILTERLNAGRADAKRYRLAKTFHVSPFLDMAVDYDWRFTAPAATLNVYMGARKSGEKIFHATLTLKRREISAVSLAHALCAYPFMTAKVLGGIYWQALRLWLKRTPFHVHPKKCSHTADPKLAKTP